MARHHRTAAQKRATAKLIAFNRAKRRHNPRRARRRNPISTAAAYRVVPTMNPIRKRRRKTGRRVAAVGYTVGRSSIRRRKMNPIRHHRRRIHRNPIGLGMIQALLMPAATAAAGALVLDVAFGYLPIPANLKTGPMNLVVKTVGALGLTVLASKVVSKATAHAMGVGALTVVLHDVAKSFIAQAMPTLKMAGLGYYSAGFPAGGYEAMNGMGVYVGAHGTPASGLPRMGGMGEYLSGMNRVDNESAYYGR